MSDYEKGYAQGYLFAKKELYTPEIDRQQTVEECIKIVKEILWPCINGDVLTAKISDAIRSKYTTGDEK